MLTDTLPKAPAHVPALDHAIRKEIVDGLPGAWDIGFPDRVIVDLTEVDGVGVAGGGWVKQKRSYYHATGSALTYATIADASRT